MDLKFTVEEIIRMQEIVGERIGGATGVRDMGLLGGVVEDPFLVSFGQEICPGVMDKAAKYASSFDRNQIFVDGNKRVAVSTMLGWLARNGYKCTFSAFQLHELVMDLANGSNEDELADILDKHTEKTEEFVGMNLEEMMNALLDTYEEAYIMLSKGPDDETIDEWKQEKIASGDDGDYRRL